MIAAGVAMTSILLIEDEPVLRMTFGYTLERHGYQVTTAATGAEGMLQCRRHQPDLIIADLFLPDNEGFRAIETLHKEFPDTDIIAMSGIAGPSGQTLAKSLGAAMFVAKPVDTTSFARYVAAYIEKRQVGKDLDGVGKGELAEAASAVTRSKP